MAQREGLASFPAGETALCRALENHGVEGEVPVMENKTECGRCLAPGSEEGGQDQWLRKQA